MSLQCFDPEKYEINTDEIDGQCIAPNSRGTRCYYDLSLDELQEANQCRNNARVMDFGPARDWELERHVLARCCGDHHRQKLKVSPSQCLSMVARKYSNMIENPRAWRDASHRVQRAKPASSMQFKYSGEPRDRYMLEPRVVGPKGTVIRDRALPVIAPASSSPFEPYLQGPRDNINVVLTQRATEEYRRDDRKGAGFVYVLAWPSYPDYVKIGYTTKSAADRAMDLDKCHRGIKVAFAGEWFNWPKRIERLVHLELAKSRRKIRECPTCRSEHYEWFESSAGDVIQTIKQWKRLEERERLYDADGCFTDGWKGRVEAEGAEISASFLHAKLDTEELLAREAVEASRRWDRVDEKLDVVEATTSKQNRELEALRVAGLNGVPTQPKSEVAMPHTDKTIAATVAERQVLQAAEAIGNVAAVAIPQVAQVVVAKNFAQGKAPLVAQQEARGNGMIRSVDDGVAGQTVPALKISQTQPDPREEQSHDDGPDMWSFFGDFMSLVSELSLADPVVAPTMHVGDRGMERRPIAVA